eukprot:m.118213 g.118213  ORF g.118213 m.118213 type:complete len:487 (-) comp14274_c0_seq4:63-1523(-)
MYVLTILLVCTCATLVEAAYDGSANGTYTEKFFNQTLDHFRFTSPRKTFMQRYLYSDEHWTGKGQLSNGCKGPILFYTGNEGPIDAFWGSNGFMIDVLAPKWGGLLVFGELRYYGKTQPFGNESLTPENAVYLTTEQALADYATLLTTLKTELNAENCPVIAFGGSYGGTLTTYFRLKYPTVVAGGLAASAPIGYYANTEWTTHNVDQFTWIDIVNKVYDEAENGCLATIEKLVHLISDTGSTSSGLDKLAKTFHTCAPVTPALLEGLVFWFTDAIETIPQLNYPYAVGTLPGWPVNATCKILSQAKSDDDLLAAAGSIADMYYSRTGNDCVSGQGQGGVPGGGPGPAAWGSWSYQSCTENLHQFSGRGVRNFTFNMNDAVQTCMKYFNTQPDPLWVEKHFGGFGIGDGLTGVSNLVWSNGLLDPWHGGGFLEKKTSNPVILMPHGAHHLDLRGPHPDDPADVTACREAEESYLHAFIQEYAEMQK